MSLKLAKARSCSGERWPRWPERTSGWMAEDMARQSAVESLAEPPLGPIPTRGRRGARSHDRSREKRPRKEREDICRK